MNKATPPITWAAPAAITYGTALSGTQLNATSTVAGAFVYTPASGATLAAGPQTLSVTFTPTDSVDYTPASTTVPLTVNQAAQTITFATLPASVTYGVAPLTLSASGGASGNAVTFTATDPASLNGTSLSINGAGTATVTANQAANANYSAAKQVIQTIQVNQAATTTGLTAATLTPTQTQADLLTATVTGAGTLSGSVVFAAGGTTICTSAVGGGGVATCSYVPAGTGAVSVTAQYLPDANHLASSNTLSLNVQPLYDAAITIQLASTTVVYPGATNVTVCITRATKVSPTGAVSIYDGATLLDTATVVGGGCAYWYIAPGLNAGTHSIGATYSGDKHNAPGTAAPVTLTVNPVPVNLAIACPNPTFTHGPNFQCVVTASSNAGPPLGSITYSLDNGAATAAGLSGGNATVIVVKPAVGNHTLTINYAQQTNYAAASPITQAFTVTATPSHSTTRLTAVSSTITLGQSAQLTATVTGAGPTGTVVFSAGGVTLCTSTLVSGAATCTSHQPSLAA